MFSALSKSFSPKIPPITASKPIGVNTPIAPNIINKIFAHFLVLLKYTRIILITKRTIVNAYPTVFIIVLSIIGAIKNINISGILAAISKYIDNKIWLAVIFFFFSVCEFWFLTFFKISSPL